MVSPIRFYNGKPLLDGELCRAKGDDSAAYWEYFTIFENATRCAWREKSQARLLLTISSYGEMFEPQTLARAKAALDAADFQVGSNSALKKRLAFLRCGHEYSAPLAELLGLQEKPGRSGFPLKAKNFL
jgi:hypothetical protein